jgi:hypothetical protein
MRKLQNTALLPKLESKYKPARDYGEYLMSHGKAIASC